MERTTIIDHKARRSHRHHYSYARVHYDGMLLHDGCVYMGDMIIAFASKRDRDDYILAHTSDATSISSSDVPHRYRAIALSDPRHAMWARTSELSCARGYHATMIYIDLTAIYTPAQLYL